MGRLKTIRTLFSMAGPTLACGPGTVLEVGRQVEASEAELMVAGGIAEVVERASENAPPQAAVVETTVLESSQVISPQVGRRGRRPR